MDKQIKSLCLSFHQDMLRYLTKKPSVTYNEAYSWLKAEAESLFSSIALTIQAYEPSNLEEQIDSIKKITDDHMIIAIGENSKYIQISCQKNYKIPLGLGEIVCLFLNNCLKFEKAYNQTRIYEEAKLFYDLMDQEKVLKTLLECLKKVFPHLTYCLFLSFDQDQYLNLPAKEIDVQDESMDACALEVYLSGQVILKNKSVIYIPIKGRQGIYGVLKVEGQNASEVAGDIGIIANAAGKAFENARLYEQSKSMIDSLMLINETSHQLNRTRKLPDMMKNLSERLVSSFGAEEVGFFYNIHLKQESLLPGSTAFFQTEAAAPYIEYVKEKISEESGVFVGNGFALFGVEGYASLMGVPMIENNENKGLAIVLKKNVCAFTFEMFKLFQTLIRHSTLAITNSMLRDRLKHLVQTDQLTELYSRAYLDENVQHSIVSDNEGVLVLIDIDNFKKVNDTYGHQTGDEILISVGKVIQQNIREQDIGARWGGEELAIYLPKSDLSAGERLANRLIALVRESTNPTVTISCGISYWSLNLPKTLTNLVKQADEALYAAKRNGKNRLMIHGSLLEC
ncbi:sensor domain-containing diguanylate cyclase [Bacillus changyiensis]|uniref:sensor domain-containing diguanylate cyclase n=1 Tax=Bacillus changyiensis TaxID=3004103 RepID=UPI0022E17459|nr:GGDEF domain-containing protein [Bacillus changyiensis]MDA1477626.1 GGDEF domain-containing protein [Bacillus changyiensis]